MKNLYYLSILPFIIFTFNSCKTCDEDHCEAKTFEQIKLVFNMDSLNGQYKVADLDFIQIQERGSYQTTIHKPDKTGQFTIISGNGQMQYDNIFIVDQKNGGVNVLNDFEYYQENPDCACRENMVIKTFSINVKTVKLTAPGSSPYIITINKK
jgi:hypothetical protein